jgi:DNA polymerase-3 subunit alpha
MVKIPELIAKVKDLKMTHCAITDHGSMAGIVDFYDEAVKNNIVPILGCEMYIVGGSRHDISKGDVFHITLLAKNRNGYDNLIKLMSIGHLEGKHGGKPHIDNEVLGKYKSGIIAMSGCMSGKISQSIIAGDIKLASDYVRHYKEMFGTDFVLEIMDNNIKQQYTINDALIKLGKKYDVPIVMTNDIHYINKEDAKSHDILERIRYNKKEFAGFDGHGYHLRSVDEFDKKYQDYIDTDVVTKKIKKYSIYDNEKGEFFMPEISNAKSKLKKASEEGLINRLEELYDIKFGTKGWEDFDASDGLGRYQERLKHELKIINDLGFPDYFLVVKDVVDWCRENDILVGVGRGSAGGSLVSYSLGIVGFDPMNEECPLYFERFLNPHRISPPDIDVDITDKDGVVSYLKEKYGNKVISIGAISTLGTKDVLNNIARVTGNFNTIKPLVDMLPSDTNDTTNKEQYEKNPAYKDMVDNSSTLTMIYDHAVKLEGLYKNMSVHASGLIISSMDINVPLFEYKGSVATQYDMHNVEKLGYIKFDFLGLKTLKIVERTASKIGKGFIIDDIDYWKHDEKTYELINDARTTCVFQWESEGYKSLIKRVKPTKLSELVDLNTLYRPGPMESGMTDQYIHRKDGKEKITSIHPMLDKFLTRQGLPLFQEEVMRMCNVVAGFTMAEADTIRKAIGKKDQKLLREQEEKFVSGCQKHGKMSKKEAEELWGKLEKFGRYSWNLSHGLAYTIISYWTAYLSAHYPAEFFASNMDIHKDNFDRMLIIINEASSRGVEIVPPNINISERDHVVKDGKIYMTLDVVKGIGDKVKDAILEERGKNGEFRDFADFCERVPKKDCNSLMKECLIFAGAFDSGAKGMVLLEKRCNLLLAVAGDVKKKADRDKKIDRAIMMTPFELLREEFAKIGMYVRENPIEYMKFNLIEVDTVVVEIVNVHKHTDKKGGQMAFITATDYKSSYDFVVFSKTYGRHKDVIKVGSILAIRYEANNVRGHKFIDSLALLTKDKDTKKDVVNEDTMKLLLPVVSYEKEIVSNFNFDRYIIYRDKSNRLYIYRKGAVGTSNKYSVDDIIGYKFKS